MCRDSTKPIYLANTSWGPFSASTATTAKEKKKSVMNNPGFHFCCVKATYDKTNVSFRISPLFPGDNSPDPPALMMTFYNPSISPFPFQADCVSGRHQMPCSWCLLGRTMLLPLPPSIHTFSPISWKPQSLWGLCLHIKLIGLLSYQGGICIQTDGGKAQSQTSFS